MLATGNSCIVLRYLKNGQAVERLAGFVSLEHVRGSDIFKAIKNFIAELGIDNKLCRGQGYDGAGTMAGGQRGCQALLKTEAKHFHCSSHQLNLALSKACSIPEVHRMVSTMKQLGIFFKYSPKRQRVFENEVKEINKTRDGIGPRIAKSKFKVQDGLSGTLPLRISIALWSLLYTLLNKSVNLLCIMIVTLNGIQKTSLKPMVSCVTYDHLNSLLHFMSAASSLLSLKT